MSESREIIRPENRYSDAELGAIGSFSDAIALGESAGYTPEDFAESYGSGFRILETAEKARLVGVPFYVLEWAFNLGDMGEFVSMAVVTEADEKLIVNDGSTGICQQMEAVTLTRTSRGQSYDEATHGLLVRGGLRRSDYDTVDGKPLTRIEREQGVKPNGKGTTYYLAN